MGASHVEPELHDVSVFDDVFFPFDSEFSCFSGFCIASESDEIVEGDGFGRDETAFEVGVDDACGLGGFVAGADGPCAGLLFTGCEVGAESKEVVNGSDQAAHSAFFDTEAVKEFEGLCVRQFHEFAFDLSADDHGRGSEMFAGIGLNGPDVMERRRSVAWKGGVGAFGQCRGCGEIGLAHVTGEDGGFVGEQEKLFGDALFFVRKGDRVGGFPVIQRGEEAVDHGGLSFCLFVTGADKFLEAFLAFGQ